MNQQTLALGDRVMTTRDLTRNGKPSIPAGTFGTVCGVLNAGRLPVDFGAGAKLVSPRCVMLTESFVGPRWPVDQPLPTRRELVALIVTLAAQNRALREALTLYPSGDSIRNEDGCRLHSSRN